MRKINPKWDALIIVDVQNDFCPGGKLAVPHGNEVVTPINESMKAFSIVIATQDWHPANHCSFKDNGGEWPEHCIAGTPGADLHPDLDTSRVTHIIRKAYLPNKEAQSGFGDTALDTTLDGLDITRVFIRGLATDFCVKATALDAHEIGFDVVVDLNACRGVFPDTTAAAIEEMRAAGITIIE